jgi:5-methylcytosine-specific restriction protein A
MPTTYRPCSAPGCPNLSTRHLCSYHLLPTLPKRASPGARGYGYDWRQTRKRVLVDRPDCQICGAPATQVDHLLPIRQGGTSDDDNLVACCARCHSSKTAARDGGFGNPRR